MGTEPSRARVWLALWAVYLLWGSTYLAIRVAVHPSHGVGVGARRRGGGAGDPPRRVGSPSPEC
jgi:hypothetical protein